MLTRKECEELVKGPGPFEGNQPWVPYFWEIYNGGEDNPITVEPEDRSTFPELLFVEAIEVRQDSDGFVFAKCYFDKREGE